MPHGKCKLTFELFDPIMWCHMACTKTIFWIIWPNYVTPRGMHIELKFELFDPITWCHMAWKA